MGALAAQKCPRAGRFAGPGRPATLRTRSGAHLRGRHEGERLIGTLLARLTTLDETVNLEPRRKKGHRKESR